MKISHKLCKVSLVTILTGISLSSFAASPNCDTLIALGGAASVTPATLANLSSIPLSDVNSCLAQCTQLPTTGNPATDAANAVQCTNNLSVVSYAVTYGNALQGYAPLNQFTATPSAPGNAEALPPSPAAPAPMPPQDSNTSTAPGYATAPKLSTNNANNANNTNSGNNNISNNTRSYIRWY